MTSTRALLFMSLALAACSDRGLPGQSAGYLASDKCIQALDANTCASQGCEWMAVESTTVKTGDGSMASTFVCVGKDPCQAHDEAGCVADSVCAWSEVDVLCPLGSDCSGGGFCHTRTDVGGDCACVSPVACPADGPCPKVECDCSGGGASSGGGACSCACPACAPGEMCPPCACNCEGGGGGGEGCGDVGTCACACPACGPDETCAPCECSCGSGGGTGVTNDGPQPTPPCECDCAPCAPDGADCPPCVCNCGTMGGGTDGGMSGGSDGGSKSTGCIPPPPPPSSPLGGGPRKDDPPPIACPAIACASPCESGPTGADGCPTCLCP